MKRKDVIELEKFLVKKGHCSKCDEWMDLLISGKDWLPKHDHKGRACSNVGYSADDWFYKVKNAEDAVKLSQIISEDKGECLSSTDITDFKHSMSCENGNNCLSLRKHLKEAMENFTSTKVK